MCLVNGALSVEHIGGNAGRSEEGDQIVLAKAALFHEKAQGLERLGMAQWIAGIFELPH